MAAGPRSLSLNDGESGGPAGGAGAQRVDEAGLARSTPGNRPERSLRAGRWAQAHAIAVGFDPDREIVVDGVDVAYRQADDCQPRPEVVVQFTQQRPDLEEKIQPDVAADKRTALRAGTTLIAGVDGKVKYIIAKPLPLSVKPDVVTRSTYVHEFGEARLADIKSWFTRPRTPTPSASGPTNLQCTG